MAYAALDEAYQTITNPKEYIKINNKENKVSGKNKKTKKTKQKKIENFDNVNLDLSNSIEQTMVNQNNYDYNLIKFDIDRDIGVKKRNLNFDKLNSFVNTNEFLDIEVGLKKTIDFYLDKKK